jgi:hypothetical protein
LLNGQWTVLEANRLADKLAATPDDTEAIRSAWLSVYRRPPTASDLAGGRTFVERQAAELGGRKGAFSELVRVLFNTNEFLYVD